MKTINILISIIFLLFCSFGFSAEKPNFATIDRFEASNTKVVEGTLEMISKQPELVLQNLRAKSFEGTRELPKLTEGHDFDVNLISHLAECKTEYCPYERCHTKLRAFLEDKCAEGFTAYLKEMVKGKTHVLTSFASGGLFQDLRVLIRIAEQIKAAGRSDEAIELNLIDTSYKSCLVGGKIILEGQGLAIQQFSEMAFYILPQLKKIHIYSSSSDYVQTVNISGQKKSDVFWAIDYGTNFFENLKCSLDLNLISLFATEETYLQITFPYESENSIVVLVEKTAPKEENFEKSLELLKNLDLDKAFGLTEEKEEEDSATDLQELCLLISDTCERKVIKSILEPKASLERQEEP